ncbi:hypothetical protein J5U23_01427 [Saccharolobus shibatae B12]|uniref:Uncharacterized protein n=1 Tax=Saccharolobus shibatae (strain ATCC 51178 / DSM 5389 / JCM 8931 / NBRC 15437 / B12) TaxID=523848 RepID=A0A8F5GT42_SACSH|nr:hypothetical protein J5U23_01427 [Saccharolobus shibatae B12]
MRKGLSCFSPYLLIYFTLVILGFIPPLDLRESAVGVAKGTKRDYQI